MGVRQGFSFDGVVHWLLGTSPSSMPFHRRWGGKSVMHLGRNIKRLTRELIDFAPEGRKALRPLRRHILVLAARLPATGGSPVFRTKRLQSSHVAMTTGVFVAYT